MPSPDLAFLRIGVRRKLRQTATVNVSSVLAASRTTAVNLFWVLKRMRVVWEPAMGRAPGEVVGPCAECASNFPMLGRPDCRGIK